MAKNMAVMPNGMTTGSGDVQEYVDDAGNADYIETATGMEISLTWSDDETMVTLHLARPNLAGGHDEINMEMTGLQIDELRSFLTDRLF